MATKKTPKEVEVLPIEARCIRSIQDFKAPKTTQDATDQHAAEYMVANLLRQQADKRYDSAKQAITEAYEDALTSAKEQAIASMTKSTSTIVGVDWSIVISANKPVSRVDSNELKTELVKRGINAATIDEAITQVTKKNNPAILISAVRNAE